MSEEKTLKELVVEYINTNWNEEGVTSTLDEEIGNGNWIDDDWDEDGEHDDEHSWYQDFGRGEAEQAVRTGMETDILKKFEVTYEEYESQTEQCLWDTIIEIFSNLDS